MKSFLALLKIDLKLARRNRAVLFFNYLFPLFFFFVFAQMFDAQQGSAILLVVTMVIVLGMLGNGLFGAGMRAVQEREENVLRRYKVDADHAGAAALRVDDHRGRALPPERGPDSVSRLSILRHGGPRPTSVASRFRRDRRHRLSFVRLDHRRGRQFLAGKQHSDPDRLHADALPERRDDSAHLHAALAAECHAVHSGDLSHDRHSAASCNAANR